MEGSRRAFTFVLILAAHALLAMALLRLSGTTWRKPSQGTTPPLSVRLLPMPKAIDSSPRSLAPRASPRMPSAPSMPWPSVSIAVENPAPQPAVQMPLAAASAPGKSRLDLHLPANVVSAPSARQSALDDPRANSTRHTVESRIAEALIPSGPIVETDLGGGRRQFRQGSRCVEVHDARISAIDAFNESTRPSPKQAKPCR